MEKKRGINRRGTQAILRAKGARFSCLFAPFVTSVLQDLLLHASTSPVPLLFQETAR
jgi:hypothetical protein